MKKIFYGKAVYDKKEINAVLRVLKKNSLSLIDGPNVKILEKKVANLFGKKFGLMVNSGSSANLLALSSYNFKLGSEVITPNLTFSTTVAPIYQLGLIPHFIGVKENQFLANTDDIEKSINKKTVAIIIPNLLGNICDWKKIYKIAKKYKLKIIEDSADTLGAKIDNKPTGIYSDVSITSFYGSHIISCAGNGGMFLTNDKKLYEKAKVLRSWGRMSTLIEDSENIYKRLSIKLNGYDYDKKFVFSEVGYNFEPSEIGASFGLVQLKKFKSFNKIRNKNFKSHREFFSRKSEYFIVPKVNKNVKTNFLAYPIIIKKNKFFDRKKFQIYLEKNMIQTRPIFSGNILRHPAFKNLKSNKNKLSSFKNSDFIMKNGLLIGCHQGLKQRDINYIHKKISKFINKIK